MNLKFKLKCLLLFQGYFHMYSTIPAILFFFLTCLTSDNSNFRKDNTYRFSY